MPKAKFALIECDPADELICGILTFGPRDMGIVGWMHHGPERWLCRWDPETGQVRERKKLESTPANIGSIPNFMTFSPDGSLLAVIQRHAIVFMDASTFSELRTARFPKSTFTTSYDWSRDGRKLATGSWDMTARVWDTATSVVLASKLEKENIDFVGFAEDENELLIGRRLGVISWNLSSGKETRRLRFSPKDGYCWDHAFSPDRQTLISVSERGALFRTQTKSWHSECFTTNRNSSRWGFDFSPDGTKLIMNGSSSAQVWDVAEGRNWLKQPHAQSASFSEDGTRIAYCFGRNICVMDFRTNAKERILPKPTVPEGLLQCVRMGGSDKQMDQTGNLDTPVNPLPAKCATCKLPDLNYVPQPYRLARRISDPADMAEAEMGNFLFEQVPNAPWKSPCRGCAFSIRRLNSSPKGQRRGFWPCRSTRSPLRR